MLKQILAATSNQNKLEELKTTADLYGVEIISPASLASELGAPPEVEETGDTFVANALLKAKAFYDWSGGIPSLADDSGLEVVALDGRPGIYSARYGGEGLTDLERCEKLLEELANLESEQGPIDRTAQYVCSLNLYISDSQQFTSSYSLVGRILKEKRGTRGFGYNPIVLIDKFNKTLAEVSFELVCKEGFRASALKKLLDKILEES